MSQGTFQTPWWRHQRDLQQRGTSVGGGGTDALWQSFELFGWGGGARELLS